jgi:hypothetical protein
VVWLRSPFARHFVEGRAERRRVESREPIQARFDRVEVPQQSCAIHQAALQHLPHVADVLLVPALDLCECLRVQFEVEEGERAFARDEGTAIFPPRPDRNEVRRCGELDVELQAFLQSRDGTKQRVVFGHELHIHVDRRGAPSVEHGGGAAREIHASRIAAGRAECLNELPDAAGVGYLAHASARSKLTSRRTRNPAGDGQQPDTVLADEDLVRRSVPRAQRRQQP